jgi:hypothetical protein
VASRKEEPAQKGTGQSEQVEKGIAQYNKICSGKKSTQHSQDISRNPRPGKGGSHNTRFQSQDKRHQKQK